MLDGIYRCLFLQDPDKEGDNSGVTEGEECIGDRKAGKAVKMMLEKLLQFIRRETAGKPKDWRDWRMETRPSWIRTILGCYGHYTCRLGEIRTLISRADVFLVYSPMAVAHY